MPCFLYEANTFLCLCTINYPLQFHHRDPGIVGLITRHSEEAPKRLKDSENQQNSPNSVKPIYYGLIADGHHTFPSAIRIAYRANKTGWITS